MANGKSYYAVIGNWKDGHMVIGPYKSKEELQRRLRGRKFETVSLWNPDDFDEVLGDGPCKPQLTLVR